MKFRKKPVVIEAIQLTKGSEQIVKVYRFITGEQLPKSNTLSESMFSDYIEKISREGLKIKTLEGEMTADINDWVIKGIKGEFYPCKPDIFEATYEKVE